VLVEPKGHVRLNALKAKEKLVEHLKADGFLEADTSIELKPLSRGSHEFALYVNYEYIELLTVQYVIEAMIMAEQEGCDAVTVACMYDPGIEQAREVLNIPVIGICESVFALSQAMGFNRDVGIVTLAGRVRKKIYEMVDKYRFRPHLMLKEPVRTVPVEVYMRASTNPNRENIEELKTVYINVAKELIHDGAELLINACGGMGPLLFVEGLKDVDGVPVLEPLASGIKMAEVIIKYKKLGIFKGRIGGSASLEDIKRGRSYFGLNV